MADVRPLPGLRYAEPLEPLVAPPYDVLSEEQVAAYRARSPHNVVHLTRPGDDYAGAAALLRRWIDEGLLVQDDRPAMLVHQTRFAVPAEAERVGRRADERPVRTDLIAALRLVPYEDRIVLPHERTHRGP